MTLLLMLLDAVAWSNPAAAGPPVWLVCCAFTGAHVLAGIILAAGPRSLWWPIWCALLAKEGAVMLAAGDWSVMAWGAAVANLEALAGGFLAARWRLTRETGPLSRRALNQCPDPPLAPKE